MRTQHGVEMSPRMERLWRFIREERRIDLTDFSTDECVERVQAALRVGEKVLLARVAADAHSKDLRDLLEDYRRIMNRRPRARTTEAMLRSERRALAARGDGAGRDRGGDR